MSPQAASSAAGLILAPFFLVSAMRLAWWVADWLIPWLSGWLS